MSRILSFLIFLTIISSVYFGMHFYVYKRLVLSLLLSENIVKYIRVLFWLGGISFLLGEILRRQIGFSFLVIIGVFWMGLIAIAFSVTLIKDIVLLIPNLPAQAVSKYALILIVIITSFSLFGGIRYPRVKNITLSVKGLPAGKKVFRVIQISDVHLDGIKPSFWVKEMVDRINACQPDLIVVTGDLIDHDMEEIKHYIPLLQRLRSPHGIYTVSGNHEYYSGIDNYLQFVDKCGMKELSNQVVQVTPYLQIAGVPDPTGKQFGLLEANVADTLSRLAPDKITLFLSHQPLFFDQAVEKGVTLQLSGHTHAGQIPPMDLIVRLVFRHAYGFHRSGESAIYTTCGTGIWGPPMRLFSRSEIVLITLTD